MSDDTTKESLFVAIGGKATLEKVHKIFYDKIYEHPWISKFFEGIDQTMIENQQTDFMSMAMGGPQVYAGKFPIPAHKHMNISDELFELRSEMLKASIKEAGVPEALAEKWLKIDSSFKKGIVKKNYQECEKRFNTDEILDFPDPRKKTAA